MKPRAKRSRSPKGLAGDPKVQITACCFVSQSGLYAFGRLTPLTPFPPVLPLAAGTDAVPGSP